MCFNNYSKNHKFKKYKLNLNREKELLKMSASNCLINIPAL